MHLRRGVRIGRPFGIPLVVHGSWFPAAVLLVLHFTLSVYTGIPVAVGISLAVVSSVAFFASLVAHELAHAVVARWLGIPVLDITLFVFGGVARIAREPARPSQETVIAAAGPLASAAIGATALALQGDGYPGYLLWTIGLGNLALAAFNLLPGFPLDGGRILRAWLWARTGDPHTSAMRAGRAGQAIGGAVASAGVVVWLFTRGDFEGLWLIVLGVFLYVLATASRRASKLAARLGRQAAGRWASPFAGTLSPDDRLAQRTLAAGGHYAVARDGRLAGVLTVGAAGAASGASLVGDAMVPWTSKLAFPAAQPLTRALELLAAEASGVLVVVDDSGSAVGVLDHAGVRARLDGR